MNDNFNPQEHNNENEQQNFDGGTPPASTPQRENSGQVWSVPKQEGPAYRPPYYAEQQQTPPPPQAPTPPSGDGWQRKDTAPVRKEAYQWNYADYEQAVKPPHKKKGLMVFSIVMASVVVLSLVSFAGVGIASMMRDNASASQETPSLAVPQDSLPGITLQDKPDVTEAVLPEGKLTPEQIVEKLEPSIVAITTYVGGQTYQSQGMGMGSGIIIREDGYIVTNAHVVEGARGITVTMSDGTTKYEARVIGSDTRTDLAVLKIDVTGLTPAEFGNSDQLKVGEAVLAIGNPQSLDFAGSVTRGIVSGLNRSLTASGGGSATTSYSSLIQTDAAINPGNSGGALVNEYGQVIGINSAKVIATGAEGMGFAIPSSQVKPIVDDLIANGRVTGRVLLGVTVYQIDEVNARLNNVPVGLLVQTTTKDSDISKKGVVPGDILTKVNDKEITSQQVLTDEIKDKKPGDTVALEVYRPGATPSQKGKFFSVSVKLIEDLGTTNNTNPQADSYDQQPDETFPYGGETQPPSNGGQPGYNDQEIEDFFNDFFN